MSALTNFITNTRTTMMGDAFSRKPKARQHHRANAKTTDKQVLEIVHLRERRGWSPARIATKLGLSKSCVQSVINGNGTRTVLLKP